MALQVMRLSGNRERSHVQNQARPLIFDLLLWCGALGEKILKISLLYKLYNFGTIYILCEEKNSYKI